MITFSSSTFSGTESSEVISATVMISGGIVSSRDISVPITFTSVTATGSHYYLVCIHTVTYIQDYVLLSVSKTLH